ncbi:MAG: helix-turn-helix transcriptional regulator [Siphonobacter sp.]
MSTTLHPIYEKLSTREKHVLFYLSLSLNSQEIALKLGVSKSTIDTHRRNIKYKLGLTGIPNALIRFVITNKDFFIKYSSIEENTC